MPERPIGNGVVPSSGWEHCAEVRPGRGVLVHGRLTPPESRFDPGSRNADCAQLDRVARRYSSLMRRLATFLGAAVLLCGISPFATGSPANPSPYRVDHVVDGDTIALTNGQRVRLVQIDTPEIHTRSECYGAQASAITKRLLPRGTAIRLASEPATDRVDQYRRLLRYVIRVRDGLNVNVHLVALGAAAPYFYDGRRGSYATVLERVATKARAKKLGLWGACPGTHYTPNDPVTTATKPVAAPPKAGAKPWNRNCYPAWNFKPGCYGAADSYLVAAFARWIGECLPGDTSTCQQDATAHYYGTCRASTYRKDCPRIFKALVEDGRKFAARNAQG
jgi:endonuclease YncB( thermonuclease family)